MKEAVGQTISLQVILVFMIFLNAFLAFSVNYTKAFRVKNKVINIIEQNEGFNNVAVSQIHSYMDQVGYRANVNGQINGLGNCQNGVCIQIHCVGRMGDSGADGECKASADGKQDYRVYYNVTTFINVDVPLINKVLNQTMSIFRVQGDTSTIYVDGTNNQTAWS